MADFALWQQNPSYPARQDRAFLSAFMSEGVLSPADGHLAVSERSAGANMSVDVAAGRCVVDGDETADQESYLCVFDDATNLTVASADPDDPRKDRVIVRVQDSAVSGSSDGPVREVLTGTAGSSPSAPAVPDSAISIAIVDVAAGANSVTDANITDDRSEAQLAQAIFEEAARQTAAAVFGSVLDSRYLELDGTNSPTAALNIGSQRLTNVANPTAGTDALNRQTGDSRYANDPHTHAEHDSTVPRIASGSYTGDGTVDRTISVGFTPKMVTVTVDSQVDSDDAGFTTSQNVGFIVRSGASTQLTTSFRIVPGGFQVSSGDLNDDSDAFTYTAMG